MATHSLDVPISGPQRPSLAEFERIYTAEFAFVWRVLRRFGVQQEQLEDAAQDVFVVWVRRGAELGRLASVRTCLYGISRRVAADLRRTAARTQRRHDALAAAVQDRNDSVERTLETRHALTVVDRALQELPEIQRETYWLAEVEGLSAHQIGAALRVSPNTVSSRLRLARQRLAVALTGGALPGREEPPAESRTRVWAVLLPIWDARRDLATATASSAPYLLSMTLCAALAVVAWTPSAAPQAAPAPTPDASAPARPETALERLLRQAAPTEEAADPGTTTAAPPRPAARRPAAEDPLAREARLLARAQRLLEDDRLDEALVALDEHAAVSPNGRLADEREALRAAARCRRGEREAGLAAAERWFAGRPDAPALLTARARCAAQQLTNDE